MPTLPQSSHFYQTKGRAHDITLFRSITMFGATDKLIQNISSFRLNVRSILYNIVGPTKHYFWMGLNILLNLCWDIQGNSHRRIACCTKSNLTALGNALMSILLQPLVLQIMVTRVQEYSYIFQIFAAYFWLDLYVLTDFFSYL